MSQDCDLNDVRPYWFRLDYWYRGRPVTVGGFTLASGQQEYIRLSRKTGVRDIRLIRTDEKIIPGILPGWTQIETSVE